MCEKWRRYISFKFRIWEHWTKYGIRIPNVLVKDKIWEFYTQDKGVSDMIWEYSIK